MKSFLSGILRLFFNFNLIRKKFHGINRMIITPLKLTRGVQKKVRLENDITMNLEIEDWIPRNLYFTGHYEKAEILFLKNNLNVGDVFIDVGANIGLHTLSASKFVEQKGKVFSFEPFKKNYDLLKENISLNNLSNISAYKKALSNKSGSLEIFFDSSKNNTGTVSLFNDVSTYSEKVESITLDSFVEKENIKEISLIKIDVEGAEYLALLGMKKVLQKFHPILLIEIDEKILKRTPHTKGQIIDFLTSLNYQIHFMCFNGSISKTDSSYKTFNYVFLKEEI
ncbi:MAG: FkbM family methyltransferase [Balneola sp.]